MLRQSFTSMLLAQTAIHPKAQDFILWLDNFRQKDLQADDILRLKRYGEISSTLMSHADKTNHLTAAIQLSIDIYSCTNEFADHVYRFKNICYCAIAKDGNSLRALASNHKPLNFCLQGWWPVMVLALLGEHAAVDYLVNAWHANINHAYLGYMLAYDDANAKQMLIEGAHPEMQIKAFAMRNDVVLTTTVIQRFIHPEMHGEERQRIRKHAMEGYVFNDLPQWSKPRVADHVIPSKLAIRTSALWGNLPQALALAVAPMDYMRKFDKYTGYLLAGLAASGYPLELLEKINEFCLNFIMPTDNNDLKADRWIDERLKNKIIKTQLLTGQLALDMSTKGISSHELYYAQGYFPETIGKIAPANPSHLYSQRHDISRGLVNNYQLSNNNLPRLLSQVADDSMDSILSLRSAFDKLSSSTVNFYWRQIREVRQTLRRCNINYYEYKRWPAAVTSWLLQGHFNYRPTPTEKLNAKNQPNYIDCLPADLFLVISAEILKAPVNQVPKILGFLNAHIRTGQLTTYSLFAPIIHTAIDETHHVSIYIRNIK